MNKTFDFFTSDNGLDTPYLNHVKGNLVAIWHATVLLGYDERVSEKGAMTWHDIDNSALGLQLLLSFSGPDSGITEQGFLFRPTKSRPLCSRKKLVS